MHMQDLDDFTTEQVGTLTLLCERYHVEFDPQDYAPQFDLPKGWVGGWVGGPAHNGEKPGFHKTIYVGVSPEGDSHS